MKWVIATALSIALAMFPSELRAKNSALVLHQTSFFLGEQVTYLLPNLIAIKSEMATIIVHPKEDTIFMYSSKKKIYLDMPYSEWIKRFQGRLATDSCCRIKQGKTGTVCGWECIRYVREPKMRQADLWEFWMAQKAGLPPATLGALVRFADFPQVPGLPLRAIKRTFNLDRSNGKVSYSSPINALETTKIERTPIPSGLLKLPTGYRKVDDELELLLSDDGESMEGLFDEALPGHAAAKPLHKPAR